jgi:hypothetical protein
MSAATAPSAKFFFAAIEVPGAKTRGRHPGVDLRIGQRGRRAKLALASARLECKETKGAICHERLQQPMA